MAKLKLPDGIKVKQTQYKKLFNVWVTIKEQLKLTQEILDCYAVTELSDDRLRLVIFGFSFQVAFVHNFKLGQVVYIRDAEGDSISETLVTINFDEKGKLGEPYNAYAVKDFSLVNLNVLDSITSVSRLVK